MDTFGIQKFYDHTKYVYHSHVYHFQVPTFNKKEEIFSTLCEYSVPLVRAAWFIKMTAAHMSATQEKRYRRQAADQSVGE